MAWEPGLKLLVAWISPGQVAHGFLDSVLALQETFDFDRVSVRSGPLLAAARNDVVRTFLEGGNEWLLMLDADMTFSPDAVALMVSEAEPSLRPVVAGRCVAYSDAGRTLVPVCYRWDVERAWFVNVAPPRTSGWVDATGAACLLVHRSVFALVEQPGAFPWFRYSSTPDGDPVGEDLGFFELLHHHDIRVWLSMAEFGHVKPVELSIGDWGA